MKQRILSHSVLLSFVATLALIPSFASAKKIKAVADMNSAELASEIEEIKTAIDSQGKNLATMGTQVAEVVKRNQTMSGDVGAVDKKNRDQDRILTDAQNRLQVVEDKISSLTGQLQELETERLLPAKTTQRFEDFKVYARGLEYFNGKDFAKAITEFRTFIEGHKKSPLVNNAQYWIGEAYYMQSDYPMAIKEYQNVLSGNPKSAKAPTALYKQGVAFLQLQSFEDAKAFFNKVIRAYPQSLEAIQASGNIERINKILELRKEQEQEQSAIQ